MAYNPAVWVNDTTPDIDADNLNKMEKGIYSAYTKAEATNHAKVISHHETVTAGAYNYLFPEYIPEGINVKVKNVTNTATQFNVTFIKEDGTTYQTGDYLTPGVEKEYTVDFDIYGLRSYVNLTDWNFEIRYGEGLADDTVRYDVEQSKGKKKKVVALNNIDATPILMHDADINSFSINHQETVTAGTNIYNFPAYIPANTNFTIKNVTSTATQFSVRFIKADGSEYNTGDTIIPGASQTYNVNYEVFGLASYVNNTDWNFEIKVGEGIANNAVRYDKEQNKTTAEKTQARENINAANEDDMVQIQSEMQDVQNDLYVNEITDIFGSDFTDAYIAWSDGTITSFSDGRVSDFIEVTVGDELEYSLTAIGGVTAVIAAYDSGKNYLQAKSVKGIGSGSWQLNTGTYTIPEGVSYIRFESCRTTLQSDSIVYKEKVKLKDYITENVDSDLVWNGKKWAAFGTSITDTSYVDPTFLMPTGKYVPYLVQLSGLKVTNYGIAGASFLSNIMNKVKSVDLSSFDLVTIEGAVNDHATSKPIGEVGDTGDTTFAGTIYQMANYVYSNSNATLVFITDHVGRYVHINPAPDGSDFYGDCAPSKKNNYDLLQIDYINMIAKQCEYFGIPCIMAGQDASINLMTGNLYLVDHIHQSYVGGKQYAQAIWRELKTIKPRILTVS